MTPKRLAPALIPLVLAVAALSHVPAANGDGVTTVIAAVGDMACDPSDQSWNNGDGTTSGCAQRRTSSAMLADTSVQAVLGLGDYQYDCDDPADYAVSYTPTWGRLNGVMDPVAGNHEYQTGTDAFGRPCPSTNSTAAGYFSYFAHSHPESRGHFSFDVGSWHIIGLNGNCGSVGGCGASSGQASWLSADLDATTQPCVLAYWHQPRYTGLGSGGKVAAYKAFWDTLYAHHADVVLNGHVHNYQRFAALNPSGAVDRTNGITQYTVGTGGEKLAALNTSVIPQPVAYAKSFGYLRMKLLSGGWTAEFVTAAGQVLDPSSGTCHA